MSDQSSQDQNIPPSTCFEEDTTSITDIVLNLHLMFFNNYLCFISCKADVFV